jgi:hypothetical protein
MPMVRWWALIVLLLLLEVPPPEDPGQPFCWRNHVSGVKCLEDDSCASGVRDSHPGASVQAWENLASADRAGAEAGGVRWAVSPSGRPFGSQKRSKCVPLPRLSRFADMMVVGPREWTGNTVAAL